MAARPRLIPATQPEGTPGSLIPYDTLRWAWRNDANSAELPLWDLSFEWDDQMLAAFNDNGTRPVDRAVLGAAVESDFAEQLAAAEAVAEADMIEQRDRANLTHTVLICVLCLLALAAIALPIFAAVRRLDRM